MALVDAGWLTERVRGMRGDVGGRAAFVDPGVAGVQGGARVGSGELCLRDGSWLLLWLLLLLLLQVGAQQPHKGD